MKLQSNLLIVVITFTLFCGSFPQPVPAQDRTAQEKKIDNSIVRALKYISSQQRPSGAWGVDALGESTAATSLAVMSFMAAGHTPGEGPYGEQINRGIRWVIDHQEDNGMLVHKKSHGPMYSHGISALMLAEAAGMVEKEDATPIRRALEKAIRLILEAQAVPKHNRHQGGWRYQASARDSDLSVTGWQLLALRAAKDIGCDVPADAIDDAVAYVKECSYRGDRGFGYQPGGGPTATRCGTGITCLEICGKHHADETMGAADFLLEHPLRENDSYFFYGVYYCGVGMFKVGGKYWTQTRDQIAEILLKSQDTDGSWISQHHSEKRQGRVYSTSMAVLSLAVEYRYLPIYQR